MSEENENEKSQKIEVVVSKKSEENSEEKEKVGLEAYEKMKQLVKEKALELEIPFEESEDMTVTELNNYSEMLKKIKQEKEQRIEEKEKHSSNAPLSPAQISGNSEDNYREGSESEGSPFSKEYDNSPEGYLRMMQDLREDANSPLSPTQNRSKMTIAKLLKREAKQNSRREVEYELQNEPLGSLLRGQKEEKITQTLEGKRIEIKRKKAKPQFEEVKEED